MGLWESILGITSGVVALLLLWLRRRSAKKEDDYEQHRERFEEIDREIARANHNEQGRLRGGLSDDLDELDRLRHHEGDSGGSGDNPR